MNLTELRALAEAKSCGSQAGNQRKHDTESVETQESGSNDLVSQHIWPSSEDIKREAGDDWDQLKDDSEALTAFRQALITRRMIDQGEVPHHYTATTNCKRCGPVPIFEGCPPEVLGCPWCFNRIKGFSKPIGKPVDRG